MSFFSWENLWSNYISLVRLWDLIDITLVAFLVYQVFLILRGTRAFQIFLGLILLAVFYWLADRFEIRTVKVILSSIFDNWILILILLFHPEIRRALSQFGKTSWFASKDSGAASQTIEELIKSCVSLANKKIGALIVVEREADVSDFIEAGHAVDSDLSKELLISIFLPVSPLHDGAVLIRKGRIDRAGCLLPLSLNPLISKTLGTRHRAALGVTEETDAICLVVSEENGRVSVATAGKITHDLDAAQLRNYLVGAMR